MPTVQVYFTAAEQELEANGAAIPAGQIVKANDAVLNISSYQYPWCDISLALAFTNGTSGGKINVLAQLVNVPAPNNSPELGTGYRGLLITTFDIARSAAGVVQYLQMPAVPVMFAKAYLWLENLTGAAVAAGWTLRGRPRSLGTVVRDYDGSGIMLAQRGLVAGAGTRDLTGTGALVSQSSLLAAIVRPAITGTGAIASGRAHTSAKGAGPTRSG